MSYRATLKAALSQLRFGTRELAYLALTSKPEYQVRDRLAWRLASGGLQVGRECTLMPGGKRLDMVIFTPEGNPAAIVEAKAIVSFDVERSQSTKELRGLVKDIDRARDESPAAEVYGLMICTHLASPVPRSHRHLVSSYFWSDRVADRSAAIENMKAVLRPLGRLSYSKLGRGIAYGIRVEVDVWLCGPVGHSSAPHS